MSRTSQKDTNKFERVFEQLDALKVEFAELRTKNEISEKLQENMNAKIDQMSATLNQIIGKESVRAGIYGIIGAIISGLVVWLISLIRS